MLQLGTILVISGLTIGFILIFMGKIAVNQSLNDLQKELTKFKEKNGKYPDKLSDLDKLPNLFKNPQNQVEYIKISSGYKLVFKTATNQTYEQSANK